MSDGGFSVEVTDFPILWRSAEVECPKCREVRGLTMTAFPQDPSTVFRCPNKHVWDRDDIPGVFVKAVHDELVANPEAAVIRVDPEELRWLL